MSDATMWRSFFALSILLALLRFVLAGLLDCVLISKTLTLMPFIALCIPGLSHKQNTPIHHRFLILYCGLCIGTISCLYFFLVIGESAGSILESFGPNVGLLIIPILLLRLPDDFFDPSGINRCFKIIGTCIILVGSPLFIFQDFLSLEGLFHQVLHFYGDPLVRRLGYAINPEASALSIAAFSLYFLLLALTEFKKNRKCFWELALFIIGLLGVLSSTSLFILLSLLLLSVSSILFIMKIRLKSPLLFLVLILFLFPRTTAFGRLTYYLKNIPRYLDYLTPTFSGCSWDNLLLNLSRQISTKCYTPEVHVLDKFFGAGLLPYAGWYYFLLLPFLLFKSILKSDSLPLWGIVFMYLIGSVHYASVEFWGNNFLYAFAMISGIRIHENALLKKSPCSSPT